MVYAYFIGTLILGFVWLLIFIFRPSLRKEALFGAFLSAPFGLSEFWYVPEYWDPPSLFNLIDRIGFGIESILFCFFVGGLAATIYEVVSVKKNIGSRHRHKHFFFSYVGLVSLYFILEFVSPETTIHNLTVSALLTALVMMFLRRDLIFQIFLSGFIFSLLYFLLFLVFNLLFPTYIQEIYTLENFWGIQILGIPIEEITFSFSVGAVWSTFFEFIKGYRTVGLRRS